MQGGLWGGGGHSTPTSCSPPHLLLWLTARFVLSVGVHAAFPTVSDAQKVHHSHVPSSKLLRTRNLKWTALRQQIQFSGHLSAGRMGLNFVQNVPVVSRPPRKPLRMILPSLNSTTWRHSG